MNERDTPKLWRDMTPEERAAVPQHILNDPSNPLQVPWGEWTVTAKGAVLLAAHEGVDTETLGHPSCGWRSFPAFTVRDFAPPYAYRVKPEPKRETVELLGGEGNGWGFYEHKKRPISKTHRITFDLIDGKPDPDSIRMEPLG